MAMSGINDLVARVAGKFAAAEASKEVVFSATRLAIVNIGFPDYLQVSTED